MQRRFGLIVAVTLTLIVADVAWSAPPIKAHRTNSEKAAVQRVAIRYFKNDTKIDKVVVDGPWAMAEISSIKGDQDPGTLILHKTAGSWVIVTSGTNLAGAGSQLHIPKSTWDKWNIGPYNDPAKAQSEEDGQEPRFKLTAAQVSSMGIDSYLNQEHDLGNGDGSGGYPGDTVQDDVCDYYYRCCKEHNGEIAAKLSSKISNQVNALRTTWTANEEERLGAEAREAGGGTVYDHAAKERYAYREEQIGKALGALVQQGGRPLRAEEKRSIVNELQTHVHAPRTSKRLEEAITVLPAPFAISIAKAACTAQL